MTRAAAAPAAAALDPQQHYVRLAADGSTRVLQVGEAFWRLPAAALDSIGESWVISEFECSEDWPNWEMHPNADEFVYLLSGAAELLLEESGGVRAVPLRGRAAVVVPRGLWHTARVLEPSEAIFVTRGEGTEHRPLGRRSA